MSEKLSQALRGLQQSVENFEKNYTANEKKMKAKPKPLDQHDLFGLSQDNNKAITAALDSTIEKMEKLVGENA